MNRRTWLVILSVVALLSLFVAACGDEDDDDGGVTIVGGPTATSPAAGGPPTATPEEDGEETPPEDGEETPPEDGTAPPDGEGPDPDLVAQGEELYQSLGCQGCHSLTGETLVGPSFQGLFGSEETLASGETVVVDEEYIVQSIVEPNAQIVEGFNEGIMPAFDNLSDEQLNALVAFIRAQS